MSGSFYFSCGLKLLILSSELWEWVTPSCPLNRRWPCQSILAPSTMKEHCLELRNAPKLEIRPRCKNQYEKNCQEDAEIARSQFGNLCWGAASPVAGCGHFEEVITLAWRRPVSHHRQSRGEVIGRPIARNGCLVYIFIPNIDQRFDDCVQGI